MNKYIRLGKNTITVFIGNAGARLIGLLMLPFYTRWLSVEDYGTTDIISVYVSLLLGLATACIADAVFIFPKGQSVEQQKSYFSSGLCFALLSLGVTALLFKIATGIFADKQIANSFTDNTWFIYGLLVTSFLQQYIQQFVRSIDRMKIYSTTGIVLTVSTAVFSFFIIHKLGVSGYVLALILANVLATVYSFVFSGAFRYIVVKAIRKTTCVEMLKYSVPLIPTNVTWWLISALNRPLLEAYIGLTAIGLLAVANKLPTIMNTIFSIFQQGWTISVLENFFDNDYNKFYNKMLRFIFSVQIFIACLISIFSKTFILLFTTPDFYNAWKYVPILTLGVIFSNISAFVGTNFSAVKESKYYFYSCMWGGLASILCNFLLIPFAGILGACIAIVLSHLTSAISRILYSWKYNKITTPYIYIVMLGINMLIIGITMFIDIIIIKTMFYLSLLLLFVWLNRREIKIGLDIMKMYCQRKII